jgi:hypothetical protein
LTTHQQIQKEKTLKKQEEKTLFSQFVLARRLTGVTRNGGGIMPNGDDDDDDDAPPSLAAGHGGAGASVISGVIGLGPAAPSVDVGVFVGALGADRGLLPT